MKPNFALSLSMDGIALLHRAAPGWQLVGEVSLDSPDLAGDLARLRDTAARIDPSPMRCKLVVPNDQIRYMTLDTGSVSDARRRALVESALEGATPYELDELSYVIAVNGDVTQIAAVARETLAEAESFAESHGFGPVAFVAIPDRAKFVGEPYFGRCAVADGLIGATETVERDLLVIQVTGRAEIPAPTPDPIPEPVQDPSFASHRPAPLPPADVDADVDLDVDVAKTDAPDTSPQMPSFGSRRAAPVPLARDDAAHGGFETAGQDHAAPLAQEPDTAPVFGTRRTDHDGETPRATFDPEPQAEISFRAHRADPSAPASTAPPVSAPPSEPIRDDAPLPRARFMPRVTAQSESEPETTSFSTLRARRDTPQSAAPSLSGVRRDDDESPASVPDDAPIGADPVAQAEFDSPGQAAPEYLRTTHAPVAPAEFAGDRARAPISPENVPTPPEDETRGLLQRIANRGKRPDAKQPAKARGRLLDKLPRPSFRRANPTPATPQPQGDSLTARISAKIAQARDTREARLSQVADDRRDARAAEAARMTVFGARPTVDGRASLNAGYLVTGVLVLFLVAVAAWASLFMTDNIAASLNPETVVDARDVVATLGSAEQAEDMAALETPGNPRQVLRQPTLREPIRQRNATNRPRALPPVLDRPDPEAEARYAATGVWQSAPVIAPAPLPETLDDLYVASIDINVPAFDAVALPFPETERSDRRLPRQPTPAPPGTRFDLDGRGLVRAVPDGALSPDGVTIFAGRPSSLPPTRPGATRQDNVDVVLAALAQKRPRLRPGNLAERNERAELGGYSRQELATKRPKLRPELPEAKKQAEETQAEDTGTALAVASSRRPAVRPGNFDARVAAAQAAAIRPVAVVAPRQSIAPAIPSNASVTRQATVRNAINLNKINLIGVYGQPSARRALVRLSDGRYRKVKVGDAIDGGRVSAIGDSELRYNRGGRNLTLKMPKG